MVKLEQIIFYACTVFLGCGYGLSTWMVKSRLDKFEIKLDGKVDAKTCKILHNEAMEKCRINDQDHGKFYSWIDELRIWAAKKNGV